MKKVYTLTLYINHSSLSFKFRFGLVKTPCLRINVFSMNLGRNCCCMSVIIALIFHISVKVSNKCRKMHKNTWKNVGKSSSFTIYRQSLQNLIACLTRNIGSWITLLNFYVRPEFYYKIKLF